MRALIHLGVSFGKNRSNCTCECFNSQSVGTAMAYNQPLIRKILSGMKAGTLMMA